MTSKAEVRCEPGQTRKPSPYDCGRHSSHYWCGWCRGWYGVPHGHLHEGQWVGGCHTMTEGAPQPGCACRFCEVAARVGHSAAYEWRDERQIDVRPHGASA